MVVWLSRHCLITVIAVYQFASVSIHILWSSLSLTYTHILLSLCWPVYVSFS
jgi:hypothetical protein